MNDPVIGIDLGGTQLRGGVIHNNKITGMSTARVPSGGSVEEVLDELYALTDRLAGPAVKAIGIGVPSVVDVEQGIVYDVQHIPSWKEVPLKKLLEDRYHIPVWVNNDANCFALGEKYFGKGQEAPSMIGLTIGTGLGAGIIINNKLYAGPNAGAGEFGMVDYLEHNYEYYASGAFFRHCYRRTGEEVFRQAQTGDREAARILEELGLHLGNAMKMILYTYDPRLIILGGSVSKAYSFFQKNMWERIHTFAYPKSLENLSIKISELEHCGVLGAAALYYNSL